MRIRWSWLRRARQISSIAIVALLAFGVGSARAQWVSVGPAGLDATDIAIDPQTPTTVYVTAGTQIFVSTDSGTTWNALTSFPSRVSSLAIDPQTPTTMYAALSELIEERFRAEAFIEKPVQLLKSVDGGQSWTELGVWGAVSIDPHNPSILYASSAYVAQQFDVQLSVPSASFDGGVTWVTGPQLASFQAVTRMLADPFTPGTVYAATASAGLQRGADIWKSTDYGYTWTATALLAGSNSQERERTRVLLLGLDPVRPDTLYVARRTNAGDNLHRSDNGGALFLGWGNLQADRYGLTAVAIDPSSQADMYMTDVGYSTVAPRGMLRSTDSGRHWEVFNDGLDAGRHFVDVAADGLGSVYIAGPSGIYVRRVSAPGVSLQASPAAVAPGGTITASWNGLPTPTPWDWIGVFHTGWTDEQYLAWVYTSCSTEPGSGAMSGSCALTFPEGHPAGTYELRLFPGDGSTPRLVSNAFELTGSGPGGGTPTVTAANATAGSAVTVSWQGIPAPTASDWVAIYDRNTSPDEDFRAWAYVSCFTTPVVPAAQGACSLTLPPDMTEGTHHVRLFSNADSGAYNRIASASFLVVGGGTPKLFTDPAVRVTGLIFVTWESVTNPSTTDWIGVFEPGAPNDAYVAWFYTGCTTEPTAALREGRCIYPFPTDLPSGQYEFRLLANNGYGVIATSTVFTKP